MVTNVSGRDSAVGGSQDSDEVNEDFTGESSVHPNVRKYVDSGVISYEDAKSIGFLSNPENVVLLALFEAARQRGLKLELHRVDLQKGTFEFKIKSADKRLDGAIVSLTMTAVGAGLGLGVGFGVGLKGRTGKSTESSGIENMGSLTGGAILQVFKSGGETGEAAIGVDSAECQAFADMFDQNYAALTADVNQQNDSTSGIASGMR